MILNSMSWDNPASQGVARALDFRLVATDLRIT